MKINVWLCIVIVMLAILAGWWFLIKSDEPSVKHGSVNVACNLPQTGMFSSYGESIHDGIMFAMDDLRNTLLKENVTINYDFQDNKSSAKDAQSVTLKQFMKPVDIYVAGIAQPLYSILNTVEKKNVPFFTWGFEEYLLEKNINNYRTWVNLNAEAHSYIEYMQKIKPKKVLLIRPQTVGCELQYNNKIVPFLKAHDIEYNIEVFENSKTDFKDVALKAKNFNPDLYIVNGFDFHLVDLVKNFRANNMIKEKNVYWSLDLLDAANNLDKTALEGLRVTAPTFLFEGEKYKKWAARFNEKYKRFPRYTDAYAYDSAFVVAYAAIGRANSNPPKDWSLALAEIKFDGVTGPVYFREDRDLAYNVDTCIYSSGILTKEDF